MEWICKHCKEKFKDLKVGEKIGHSKFCESNPRQKINLESMKKARVNRIETSNQYMKAKKNGLTLSQSDETKAKISNSNLGRKLSDSARDKISKKALLSTHRRLRKNPITYNGVLLDSTWEVELAIRLDFLNIYWIRPDPIKWKDDFGKIHNYFPDFYLPDLDLYLDPKNPQAYRVQLRKIEILNATYSNIVWLTDLESIRNWSHSSTV